MTAALPGGTAPTRVFEPSARFEGTAAPRRLSRRTIVIGAIAAVLLAVGAIGTAVALGGAGASSEPALPTLPQPLDQHMDDLWKEVAP